MLLGEKHGCRSAVNQLHQHQLGAHPKKPPYLLLRRHACVRMVPGQLQPFVLNVASRQKVDSAHICDA